VIPHVLVRLVHGEFYGRELLQKSLDLSLDGCHRGSSNLHSLLGTHFFFFFMYPWFDLKVILSLPETTHHLSNGLLGRLLPRDLRLLLLLVR
jgi:hypothetical protein